MEIQPQRKSRSLTTMKIENDRCINCTSLFTEDLIPVSKVVISVLPAAASSEELEQDKNYVEEDELNVTILDALFSVFSGSDLVELKRSPEEDLQLSMCLRCAEILSTFYQAFIELLSFSDSSAYIYQLIPKIKEWHCRAFAHSEVVGQNGFSPEKPFGLIADTVFPTNSDFRKDAECSRLREGSKRSPAHNPKHSKNVISSAKIQKLERLSQEGQLSEKHVVSRRSARIVNQKHKQQKSKGKCSTPNQFISKKSTTSSFEIHASKQIRKTVKVKHEHENGSVPDSLESVPVKSDFQDDVLQRRTASPFSEIKIPKHEKGRASFRKTGPHTRVKCSESGCRKEFLYHWLMNNHVQQDHEKKEPMRCDKCHFYGFDPIVFKSHYCTEKDDLGRRFYCGFCNYPSPSKSSLIQHSRIHDRSIIKCSFTDCDKSFLRAKHLANHERLCHGSGAETEEMTDAYILTDSTAVPITCSHCGKLFGSRATYRSHLEIHSAERRYLCNLCGMSFKQRRALTRHNLVHKDIRRHQCVICQKKFKRKYNLTQHYQSKLHSEPTKIVEKSSGETPTEGDDDPKEARIEKSRVNDKPKSEQAVEGLVGVLPMPNFTGAEEAEVEMVALSEDQVEHSSTAEYEYEPIFVNSLTTPSQIFQSFPVPAQATFRVVETDTGQITLIPCDEPHNLFL